MPNFIHIGPSLAELWCYNRFSRWRPLRRNFTSGFGYGDVDLFRMSIAISKPYLVGISQSVADFQDGGRQPCWVCFGIIADHPRSVFCGLNSVLKSLAALCNISGDIAMSAFWLATAYSRCFWGVFVAYFPCMTSLGGKTTFEIFSVRISATVRAFRFSCRFLHEPYNSAALVCCL